MAECKFKEDDGSCAIGRLMSMPQEYNKVEITNDSIKINGTQINYVTGLTVKATSREYPEVTLSFDADTKLTLLDESRSDCDGAY